MFKALASIFRAIISFAAVAEILGSAAQEIAYIAEDEAKGLRATRDAERQRDLKALTDAK